MIGEPSGRTTIDIAGGKEFYIYMLQPGGTTIV
jgi:hypothetical protein